MEVVRLLALGAVLIALAGCGSAEPAREVTPLTARPPVENDFSKLKTPEEKIEFIQKSKAPDAEKARAISQVRAGAL